MCGSKLSRRSPSAITATSWREEQQSAKKCEARMGDDSGSCPFFSTVSLLARHRLRALTYLTSPSFPHPAHPTTPSRRLSAFGACFLHRSLSLLATLGPLRRSRLVHPRKARAAGPRLPIPRSLSTTHPSPHTRPAHIEASHSTSTDTRHKLHREGIFEATVEIQHTSPQHRTTPGSPFRLSATARHSHHRRPGCRYSCGA